MSTINRTYEKVVSFYSVQMKSFGIFSAPKSYVIVTDYAQGKLREHFEEQAKNVIKITKIPTNSVHLLAEDNETMFLFKPNY